MLKQITDLTLTELKHLCAIHNCTFCPVGCKNKEIETVQVLDEEYDEEEIRYPVRLEDIIELYGNKCKEETPHCESCDFGFYIADGISACIFDVPMALTGERIQKFMQSIVMLPHDVIMELKLGDKVVGNDAKTWVYTRPDGEEEESDTSVCEAHVE